MNANGNAFWEVISDLYMWELETHKTLPMYAARIAEIEQKGGIVDLEIGKVFYPKGEEQREPAAISEL